MTTTLVAQPRTPAATREPRARFTDLLAAEWLKLWSLRSTKWAFLATALVIIGLNAMAAHADNTNWPTYDAAIRKHFVPSWAMNDAFSNGSAYLLIIACATIGANMVVSEYGTRLIRTTFAAVPARRSVMAAKAAVAIGAFTAFGALLALASFGITQWILSAQHINVPITYPGVPRVLVASALLAPISAVTGIAFGAVIRHVATTMVIAILALAVAPALLLDQKPLPAAIDESMLQTAWWRLSALGDNYGPGPIHRSIAYAWGVYVAWFMVSAIITVVTIDRQDV
jgi:ABC-2 type transport system permease protein